VLYNFPANSNPEGNVISDGTYLYGTTRAAGANNLGTVFKIKTDGTSYADIHDFLGTADGSTPDGSLLLVGNYMYGMTYDGGSISSGTAFKIKTDGTGYTNLVNFSTDAYGNSPFADLITDGTYFYGTTVQGGNLAINGGYGDGVVFKVKTDGTALDTLFTFNGSINGSQPHSTLYSDGTYLYGTAASGGANSNGTIFKTCMSAPCAVGIEQHGKNANAFKVYPNPVNNVLNVERAMFDKNDALEITDVLGNRIKQTLLVTENSLVDVSELNSGVYFVKIGNSTQKFIKQ